MRPKYTKVRARSAKEGSATVGWSPVVPGPACFPADKDIAALPHEFEKLSQRDERSSPASGFRGRVAVREDERRASQHSAHNFPLHADPPPVDDAQGFQTQAVRFLEISFDSCPDLLGLQGMEVKDITDRDADGFLFLVHGRSKRTGIRKRVVVIGVALPASQILLWRLVIPGCVRSELRDRRFLRNPWQNSLSEQVALEELVASDDVQVLEVRPAEDDSRKRLTNWRI